MNQYRAFGTRHGYPWGVTIVVEAEDIVEAHEVAEEQLDTVKNVAGPLQALPRGE